MFSDLPLLTGFHQQRGNQSQASPQAQYARSRFMKNTFQSNVMNWSEYSIKNKPGPLILTKFYISKKTIWWLVCLDSNER